MRRIILVVLLVLFAAIPTRAAAPRMVTEKVEWTWTDRPTAPNAKLPNVLLVGDSITRGYYPDVVKQLTGTANVYLFATSASSGDPRLEPQIHDYFRMIGVTFAVVHFNNGMHGWGYTEAEYANGLPGMIKVIRIGVPRAKLIWATTTPVLHDSDESTNPRINVRNASSLSLMQRNAIVIDDQHALMLKHQNLHDGDVHFTKEGYATQATQASNIIRKLL
jgi:hypothetical protein